MQIDLSTDAVRRTVAFDETVAPEGRHLNDVRFSPDGRWAYITDSGAVGARVVVDLQRAEARRVSHEHAGTLHDASLDARALGARVERVAENGASDGLWIDERGRMYPSALEENAVKVRDLATDGDDVTTLVQDERLRWPDTFSEGPDGTIYVTASHIQNMPWYRPGNPPQVRTTLFRIDSATPRIRAPSRWRKRKPDERSGSSNSLRSIQALAPE